MGSVLHPAVMRRQRLTVSARFAPVWTPLSLLLGKLRLHVARAVTVRIILQSSVRSVLLLQTAGLKPLRAGLYDHSLAVHAFHGSLAGARVKRALRSTLLKLSPKIASRCFTYHYAVICAANI